MSSFQRVKLPKLPALSKRAFFIFVTIFVLAAVTFSLLYGFYYFQIKVPKASRVSLFSITFEPSQGKILWQGPHLVRSAAQWKQFKVERGKSVAQIAKQLQEEGIIRSSLPFRIYARLNRLDRTVKFGTYWVSSELSIGDLVERFQQSKGIRLTFLEGWRREEFASYAARALGSVSFEGEFLKASKGKEGHLFPDTYLIPYYISPQNLVALLTRTFEEKYKVLLDEGKRAQVEICLSISTAGTCSDKRSISKKTLVILASLVERETTGDNEEEMRTIAGILIKRWFSGWKLDVDATVQYALGYQEEGETWWKKTLTKEDLKVDSLYNTYEWIGLPPGPICNPGFATLSAVSNAKPSPYWFYLHDKGGNVYYAKTLDEHTRNVVRYLR